MRFRVVDLETTGMMPPAEVIEIGWADVELSPTATTVGTPSAKLFRPLGPIPPETMAVHHITPADIPADAPTATADELRAAIWRAPKPDVLVAHNCEFERKFITANVIEEVPWICTYKVALHVWPNAPRHSNQVLRYWRGLTLDPWLAMPPHRAAPDAWVTAHLLVELLQSASVAEMIAWTHQPRPMPAIGFGKHKGLAWAEVPSDYLDWLAALTDMDADVLWHARAELKRRSTRSA